MRSGKYTDRSLKASKTASDYEADAACRVQPEAIAAPWLGNIAAVNYHGEMNELLIIQDSFVIEGRGIVLIPDFSIPPDGWKNRDELVHLEMPDGTSRDARACIDLTHFSLSDPSATADERNRVVVRLVDESERIPKGTTVFASADLCKALRWNWLETYEARYNARSPNLPLRCPCCGCKTLSKRAAFEICEVCFWEDDGQDDIDANENRGGPNGQLSLTEARINFRRIGACEPAMLENVRPPRPDEMP